MRSEYPTARTPPNAAESRTGPRCVGTCTRDTDPDGKPLRYCRGCYQDMPKDDATEVRYRLFGLIPIGPPSPWEDTAALNRLLRWPWRLLGWHR